MRLDRILSNLKYGSRKDVQKLIKDGYVKVNGKVVFKVGLKIKQSDKITIFDEEVFFKPEVTLMVYKPVGFLSANRDPLYPVVVELIEEPYSRYDLKVAGRLDLDAEGLIILTSSGKTVHSITHPSKHIKKVYEVEVNEKLDEKMLNRLLRPIQILDGNDNKYTAKAIDIKKIDDYTAHITLDSGKFHQVKRMFKAIGYEVIKLKRIQIGKLKLGDLTPGEYREVKVDDIL